MKRTKKAKRRKAREWWVETYRGTAVRVHDNRFAMLNRTDDYEFIRVREVLPRGKKREG
jgi:hypothetical protein